MEHGDRAFTFGTVRASRRSFAIGILLWILVALLVASLVKEAWFDPVPIDSIRKPGQGRMLSVLALAWLVWGVWFVLVTAGRIPFLWIRHAADGSLTVRTALGRLGLPHKVMRAPSSKVVSFKSGGGKKPNWFSPAIWTVQFSGGDRALYAIMWARFDEQELRAKVDGTYRVPVIEAREP